MDQSPLIMPDIAVNRAPELRRGQVPSGGDMNFFYDLMGKTPWRQFRIQARHIQEGRRGDGQHCAIALAWKEAYPDDEIDISGELPVINGYKLPLTAALVDWIDKFDSEQEVQENTVTVWNDPALTGQPRA